MLRAAFREQREALVDRTPKPCHHKRANHQHGTRACYVLDACRCHPCSKANAEAENWRERQKAYGRYNKYVPAGPVREHVRTLMDAGMGLKRIVAVTGVSQGTMWKLMYGKRRPDGTCIPSRRVLRDTAEKLYTLDPTWTGPLPLADGAILTTDASYAVSRKLQALVALGWSMSELGRRLGITHVRNAIPVVKGERRLTAATAKKADALYEQLSMTLPSETNQRQRIAASRSRRYAKAHGWVPPLDLEAEDVELDDEPYLDEAAILRRLDGDKTVRLTPAEAAELVRRWQASGRPLNECERHTGINPHRHVRPAREAS
jgi:transcriptional regulator with XRE-family HTH domain